MVEDKVIAVELQSDVEGSGTALELRGKTPRWLCHGEVISFVKRTASGVPVVASSSVVRHQHRKLNKWHCTEGCVDFLTVVHLVRATRVALPARIQRCPLAINAA